MPTRHFREHNETAGMTRFLTHGQLSILHSLRDGDDPLLRAPDHELIYFERDLAVLAAMGLIERNGPLQALTLAGISELDRPGNSLPPLRGSGRAPGLFRSLD
jgi:hypothetical protein